VKSFHQAMAALISVSLVSPQQKHLFTLRDISLSLRIELVHYTVFLFISQLSLIKIWNL